MTDPDGLQTLAAVRSFLEDVVLAEVPQHLAGELRAAVKLLESAQAELGCLHAVLLRESEELLDLCEGSARAQALRARLAPAPEQLAERAALHREIRGLSAETIERLQADGSATARERLDDLYATLGRHSHTRVPWQSVFEAS
jgi:hypothetical protein